MTKGDVLISRRSKKRKNRFPADVRTRVTDLMKAGLLIISQRKDKDEADVHRDAFKDYLDRELPGWNEPKKKHERAAAVAV